MGDTGSGLLGFIFVVALLAAVIGITKMLHVPGACHVGKAAWLLGNPC